KYHRYPNESISGNIRANNGEPHEPGDGPYIDFPVGDPFFMGSASITSFCPPGVACEKNDNDEALQDGLDAARAILSNPANEDCLGLFKNLEVHGLKSAEDLLDRYETNGWIKVSNRHPTLKKGKIVQKRFS